MALDEAGFRKIRLAIRRKYVYIPSQIKEPSERGSNSSVISSLRLSEVGAAMMIEGALDTQ
jgi:hypothetical protein